MGDLCLRCGRWASYVIGQKLRAESSPGRADAGAVVPLQPGLRRLRENPVPRAHPQTDLTPEQCFAAVEECGAPPGE